MSVLYGILRSQAVHVSSGIVPCGDQTKDPDGQGSFGLRSSKLGPLLANLRGSVRMPFYDLFISIVPVAPKLTFT